MSMMLSLPIFSALFATGSACAAVLNVKAVQIESPTAKVFNDCIVPVSFAAGFLVRGEENFDDWVYWFFKSLGEANLTMPSDAEHTEMSVAGAAAAIISKRLLDRIYKDYRDDDFNRRQAS